MQTVARRKISRITQYLLVLLLLIIVIIKLSSLQPHWIEHEYSTRIYPYISRFFRIVFGWIPFSIGDLVYAAIAIYIIIKVGKLIRVGIRRKVNRESFIRGMLKFFYISAAVYICFNLFWGLNYNRLGIAYQLQLKTEKHTVEDLKIINQVLVEKVNASRRNLDSIIIYPRWREIFKRSENAFNAAEKAYPFLHYETRSVKRSMYGRLGNYLGYLGYYNPLTGESQLNLTQPRFLIPFVTCHEMAHQIGYASESEANFVGYLASVHSPDTLFHYSAYFDLMTYALYELRRRDSVSARESYSQLDTLVKIDFLELRAFHKKYASQVEPIVKLFYDQYLRANQQDKGIGSYNEVIGWLIAYYKKYGKI
jgi:hypothetical protein